MIKIIWRVNYQILFVAFSVFSDNLDSIQFVNGETKYGKVQINRGFPIPFKLVLNESLAIDVRSVDLFTSSGIKYGIYHTGPLFNEKFASLKRSCGVEYYESGSYVFSEAKPRDPRAGGELKYVTREFYSFNNSPLKEFNFKNLEQDFEYIPEARMRIERHKKYRNIKWISLSGGFAVFLLGGVLDNSPTQRTGLAISTSALIPQAIQIWQKQKLRLSIENYFQRNNCSNSTKL